MQTDGRALNAGDFEGVFRSIFENVELQCNNLYDALRQHFYPQWHGRTFKCQIVDVDTLNASARCESTADVVTVHVGAIEKIYGTTYGLCATPDFLPEIGNISAEIRPSLLPLQGFPKMPLLRTDGSPTKVFTLIPSDPTRSVIASLLASIAIEFLLYHEVGHIVGGHLEIVGVHSLTELNTDAVYGNKLLARILECDADIFACDVISGVHLSDILSKTIRDLAPEVRWNQHEFALLMYCTAIGTLFRTFFQDAPSDVASTESDHPHPAVRTCIACAYAFARLLQQGKIDHASLEDISISSIRNIEEVWHMLLLPGQRLRPLQPWAGEVAREVEALLLAIAERDEMLNAAARLRRKWSIAGRFVPLPRLDS